MNKYINAEKLYKKVEELMAHYAQSEEDMDEEGNTDWATYYQGKRTTCSEVLHIITSIQQEQQKCIYGRTLEERKRACKYCSAACNARIDQEQPKVDLEKEIERWKGCEAFPEGTNITPLPKAIQIVEKTAYHFYELGRNTRNSIWHNVAEEMPTKYGSEVIVACRNKNKEDGIWLYDLIQCWEGEWKPRVNWETPVKWAYVRDLDNTKKDEYL